MSEIFPGRYTASTDEPFVVFLIGMRVNRLVSVRKWWPVASAMGPMIAELSRKPELGYLGGYTAPLWRGVVMVQFWRSFEHLESYARSRDAEHLPAWRRFNQAVGNDGSVGVWHETYVIVPGQVESVYVNMPRSGLASVMDHVPATRGRDTARERLHTNVPSTV